MTINNAKRIERPLVIASSGGGGHIAAAKGIIDELKHHEHVEFLNHKLTRYHERQANPIRTLFKSTLYLTSFDLAAKAWKWFHQQTGISNVLEYASFWKEIKYLQDPARNPLERPYVDLLLDFYSFGYEMVAIFNALQRADKNKELLSTVDKQAVNDHIHYVFIKARMIEHLKKQAEQGKPYTSIISTQPQSLGALCDAVEWYNETYVPTQSEKLVSVNARILELKSTLQILDYSIEQNVAIFKLWFTLSMFHFLILYLAKRELNSLEKQKAQISEMITPLHIHEYMTDLPTKGAVHFSSSLNRLTKKQRQYLSVHCVGEPHPEFAAGADLNLHVLSPQDNPMLRQAFRDRATLVPYATHEKMTLSFIEGKATCQRAIPGAAKVASIMLGSLGGDASAAYILPLLHKGYAPIFVFGAQGNRAIMEMIARLPKAQRECIIALGHQPDTTIAPIMTRSDCVITRSGGLSAMEQMALPIIANKLVLIHHKNPEAGTKRLTSGLPWEDANADCMIKHFESHQVKAKKTCPRFIYSALSSQYHVPELAHMEKSRTRIHHDGV